MTRRIHFGFIMPAGSRDPAHRPTFVADLHRLTTLELRTSEVPPALNA